MACDTDKGPKGLKPCSTLWLNARVSAPRFQGPSLNPEWIVKGESIPNRLISHLLWEVAVPPLYYGDFNASSFLI